MNIFTVINEILKKILKQPPLSNLGLNNSAHRFFLDMRFVAVDSKYSLVLHIFELGIFNDAPKHHQKCINSQSGPVGCRQCLKFFLQQRKVFLCQRENVWESDVYRKLLQIRRFCCKLAKTLLKIIVLDYFWRVNRTF